MICVDLNLPIKAKVRAESARILEGVHQDRKQTIGATIVRYAPWRDCVNPYY